MDSRTINFKFMVSQSEGILPLRWKGSKLNVSIFTKKNNSISTCSKVCLAWLLRRQSSITVVPPPDPEALDYRGIVYLQQHHCLFFFFLKQYLLKFGPITQHIKWFQISAWLFTIKRLAKFSSTHHDHSRCFKVLVPSAQEGYLFRLYFNISTGKKKKKEKNQKNLTIPQSHSSCVQAALIVR